jgi:hypothetical protein
MRAGDHVWAALWYGSVILLAATIGLLVRGWRIFSKPEEPDRSLKFLRAAYVWLFLSLGMLVLTPAYQFGLLPFLAPESNATQIGFSHAYYGAIRHAITVGFISLMIVGVAAKVVPTLNGVNIRALTPLWGPFVLINTGCTLRVVAQTLTDFSDRYYPVAGISGLLEVLGLAVWGCHLWLIMAGRARLRDRADSATSLTPGEPIVVTNRVGEVLDRYPGLLDTFLAFGFKLLANPLLRKTLAHQVTLELACRILDVDAPNFVDTLNQERLHQLRGRVALPLLSEERVGAGGHTPQLDFRPESSWALSLTKREDGRCNRPKC